MAQPSEIAQGILALVSDQSSFVTGTELVLDRGGTPEFAMRSIRVQLDEATYQALRQVAPAAKRRQPNFIREAIRKAVREAEYARIRAVYQARPDSETEADDWSSAEQSRR